MLESFAALLAGFILLVIPFPTFHHREEHQAGLRPNLYVFRMSTSSVRCA